MNKPIHMAVVSDIHLGHANNSASFIVDNLRKEFPDNDKTAMLDFLILAGDVFDYLLKRGNIHGEELLAIDLWVGEVLHLCKKHGIRLRILEGTPSHDWRQSQIFELINEGAKIGCDLKYVRDLSIVYEPDFDVNILYVPDEWREDPAETYDEVNELMRARGLEKVDFAIMHGQFEYQLPPVVKAPKHKSEDYLKIVKHLIFIGHVHVYSMFERIIAQGSFDRIAHGEEGPKGHVRATIYPDGNYKAEFIENKGARKYVTVECVDQDMEETFSIIERRVEGLPDDSFVRVKTEKGHPILSNMHELVLRWPLYRWSKVVQESKQEKAAEETDSELSKMDFVPIAINRDNITDLLMNRLRQKGTPQDMLDLAESKIAEVR